MPSEKRKLPIPDSSVEGISRIVKLEIHSSEADRLVDMLQRSATDTSEDMVDDRDEVGRLRDELTRQIVKQLQ